MAGSVRFELSSTSQEELAFAGGYSNGPRGNYHGASLDRSGSFREGSGSRMFSSSGSTPRGTATLTGNLPSLPQCLMLDPIRVGDQKCTSLGELRRVLGISFRGNAEDAFGAAHLKPHPPVATEELKWFKESLQDASNKARVRVKRLDESIDKLNKYCEILNLKKQQRNEFITNERSSGSNLLKMGAQNNRNSSGLMNQRLEDRTKTVVMNRRVRSSVTEIRAEGRSNMLSRQPVVMGKDRDVLRGEGSDLVAEKIRRLPYGGEAWDKKMKRKRSVGTVSGRRMDGDAEVKQNLHHKPNDEPGPQACDAQSFRSGSFNGGDGINKLDSNSSSASPNPRTVLKNELDKVSLSRDVMAGLSKERLVPKGNNKLNVRDDNQILSPNPVTKGKASRLPRNGPITASNSSPSFPRTSGTPEGWEHPPSVNKNHLVNGATNRKRPMPTGSASPPMAQWVGQRPQKISRTRRANLAPPVSNHDEALIPSEGCSPSDVGARLNYFGTNALLQKSISNGAQQIGVIQEVVSSPARLSESEESGAGENRESRLKEKGPGSGELDERSVNAVRNTGSFILPTKKNKLLNKEEIGVGVWRQGRSGRGSSVSMASTVATREKLGIPASAKPLKSTKLGSERNGSKSGRPLKKLSDQKVFACPGNIPTNGSPDFAGESGDDREELLAAANFACNSRNFACSSSFWKKMEPIFGPVTLEEASYLKEQGDIVHEESFMSKTLVPGPKERNLPDHIQKGGISCGRLDSEGMKKLSPLYQRVLSALIMEDDIEEFEKDIDWRTMSLQCNGDVSSGDTCASTNVEPRNRLGIQFANKTNLGPQTLNQYSVDSFPCNGNSGIANSRGICNQVFKDDLSKVDFGVLHSGSGLFPEFSENGADGILPGISSFDCPYEQMSLEDRLLLELQSIGLYQETVPNLADGEDEAIDRDIVGLQKLLHQQVDGKKKQLNKFIKAIEESMDIERRRREQIAMDKLVESAHKKLLATRGSIASKYGISKVPKQVAVAFTKRTLARCRKYEEAGKSCFDEPPLRDIISAAPLDGSIAEPMKGNGLSLPPENQNSHQELGVSGSSNWAEPHDRHNKYFDGTFGSLTHPSEKDFAKNGPIFYRGKKKELLLDDVGSPSLKVASNPGTMLGRAKGKRSERERGKDISARNSVAKAGRQSLGNNKGDRKTKTKPKQKTAQLSTSGNGLINNVPSASGFIEEVGNNKNNRKREVEPVRYNGIPEGPTETKKQIDFSNLQLNELDSIELGVPNDLGGNQDLSTWLNFDEDGLQDHDAEGLDIPMDDLSDLNMLL